MACHTLQVPPEAAGMRIDVFLRRYLPEVTGASAMAAFRRRDVKLDSARVRQDARVRAGQTVRVYTMKTAEEALSVVYEDDDVLLISKRAGISAEPDSGGGLSVRELALRHVRLASPDAPEPRPVHRLDNQTCGLLLLAKTPAAYDILTDVFKRRSLDKRYICLVKGRPKPPEAVCRAWLRKDAEAARVWVSDAPSAGAVPIETAYETLEAGDVSRLRVHLITGRTHQIRAHLAALGHPLLGDDLYGDRALNRSRRAQGRLMLCASDLTLQTDGRLPRLDGRHFHTDPPF